MIIIEIQQPQRNHKAASPDEDQRQYILLWLSFEKLSTNPVIQ